MSKYSFEFKKKMIESYLSGEGGFEFLAKKYSIPYTSLRNWMHSYEKNEENVLFHSREHKKYSFEYKLSVVELYLSSKFSYQELAHQEGINNPTIITKWVNEFRISDADTLRPKKKVRKKYRQNLQLI